MRNCPQCNKGVEEPTSRLVQDSCGHRKCRVCLLADVEKCKQCSESNSKTKPGPEIKELSEPIELPSRKKAFKVSGESVIKYESSAQHQGVISFNEAKDKDFAKRAYQTIVLPSHIVCNDNLYTCKVCKKDFKTKGHVKYHRYCTGGKKPLNCRVCSKEFVSKSHLDVHLLSHDEKKPHVCDKCGKSFVTRSKLKRHSLLHSGKRSYVCAACGKSFFSQDKLKVHNLIHTKEKPFACKQCKARFNNSSNLRKHSAVHLKEGVHMCDQCGKRFKLKATLMLHHRVHSNYKAYKCSNCVKAFFNLKDLQRHALVHTNDKSYTCDECKTSFRRKDNLYRHVRNSHPGKKPAISEKNVKLKPKIVDTPNAINVITSSSSLAKKEREKTPVINGPIKLAFKTSAFKNTYNIQRNIEPEDNVNIYEKILLPNNIVSKDRNEAPTEKNEPEQDVYKVFKFKLTNKEKYSHPVRSEAVSFTTTVGSSGKTYTELRTVNENCASVIVSANNQSEVFKNHA